MTKIFEKIPLVDTENKWLGQKMFNIWTSMNDFQSSGKASTDDNGCFTAAGDCR
jgi:hypothetical protein